jgi:hypothetical protein
MAVRPKVRRRVVASVVIVLLVAVAVAGTQVLGGRSAPTPAGPSNCVYTREGISGLERAVKLLGIAGDCAVIFDRASPDWSSWSKPWFIDNAIANNDWNRWAAQRGRRLVVTLGLIPASIARADWRYGGARGDYEPYARLLAHNLIAAGLGDVIIRLSNEANGNWFSDSTGSAPAGVHEWVRFWRNTVTAMRSVRGAHFRFDWTIADATGKLSPAAFYPGDRYVDYIGDDIYDTGAGLTPAARWAKLAAGPLGANAMARFSRAHDKLFSISEWGLQPASTGGGDDPSFVEHIAALTKASNFAYQAYFFADTAAVTLSAAPRSLAVYRQSFAK